MDSELIHGLTTEQFKELYQKIVENDYITTNVFCDITEEKIIKEFWILCDIAREYGDQTLFNEEIYDYFVNEYCIKTENYRFVFSQRSYIKERYEVVCDPYWDDAIVCVNLKEEAIQLENEKNEKLNASNAKWDELISMWNNKNAEIIPKSFEDTLKQYQFPEKH